MKINGLFDFQLDKELIKNCILFSIGYIYVSKSKIYRERVEFNWKSHMSYKFSYYAILVEFELN